uniref:DUF295 domain-containing protein n=1 Tax=Arundo donax TaxID=35708 RepID=A0A0A9F6W7_ARUDO
MAAGGGGDGLDTAEVPDWSRLPSDPLLVVMAALDPPDLVRSGAVCSSWRAAYDAVRRLRIPTAESGPCLFYPRAADDPDTATVYSPCSGASFRVRLPDPPLRRRSLHGSAHGWLVAADEVSDLHLVNPLTGAQLALPPVSTLHHTEAASDEQGDLIYHLREFEDAVRDPANRPKPVKHAASDLRHYMYFKVVLSCSPCARSDCIILLLHMPDCQLSFALLGDKSWTRIGGDEDYNGDDELWDYGYRDAVYRNEDSLFYVLGYHGDIITLDLNGPSPVVKKILKDLPSDEFTMKYLVMAPWGDFLQVWRLTESQSSATPVQFPEGNDPDLRNPYHETHAIQLYKVDIDNQELMRITSLGDYALFLGLNSTMIISTKDFPLLRADCAYLAHDEYFDISRHIYGQKEICIWNFRSGTLEDVDNVQPWRNWPVPMWIRPSLD